MATMLDKLIVRAANDEVFRQEVLTHPDAAIAHTASILSEDECAVLDEYRRAASRLLAQRLKDAHPGYVAEEADNAAGM